MKKFLIAAGAAALALTATSASAAPVAATTPATTAGLFQIFILAIPTLLQTGAIASPLLHNG